MMKQIFKMLVLCIFLLCTLTGCFNNDLVGLREKNAGKENSIIIGVPVPLKFAEENTKFLKGIDLALEDINAAGVNGKKIKLEIADDEGNFKTAVDIAQNFAQNTRMLAVVGHWYSDICIPVSNIYEEAGMLTLVPTVSNPDLTQKGYKYVFQSITSDKKIAEQMSQYARSNAYENVVIYYEESSYGKNLADAIENEARANGLKIVDRSSGLVTEAQIKKAHDKWQALEFDAILLALNMPEGSNFISELRKVNKDAGILSADGLDVGNFIDILGKDAEGVLIFTTYSPDNDNAELKRFKNKYIEKHNEDPDVWAIQGYESLQLIAHAIKQTNSCSPTVLADYLREMEPLPTALGPVGFNEYGEIEGIEVYQKMVVDGQFKYID